MTENVIQIQPTKEKESVKDNEISEGEIPFKTVSLTEIIFWLLWKNTLVYVIRNKKGWFCKILLPMLIFTCFVGFKQIPGQVINAKAVIDPWSYQDYVSNNILNSSQWISNVLCPCENNDNEFACTTSLLPGYLAIVGNISNSHIQGIINYLNNTWFTNETIFNDNICTENQIDSNCDCLIYSQGLKFNENEVIKYFDNNNELNKYIKHSKYGLKGYNIENSNSDNSLRPIGTAIVFNSISDNGLAYDYSIRVNSSKIVSTKDKIDKFTKSFEELNDPVWKYTDKSSFILLQNWIDHSIIKYISDLNGSYSNSYSDKYTWNIKKSFFRFPTAKYTKDEFWSNGRNIVAWFLLLGFIYPCNQIISMLVHEKSSKIKEGIKIMGVSNIAYWISWYIFLFMEMIIISGGCTIVSYVGDVFEWSDMSVIYIWILGYCINIVTFGTLISTFFDNPKTGSMIGMVLFTAATMIGNYMTALSGSDTVALCLSGPSCLVASINNLEAYETGFLGLQWDNISEKYEGFAFETAIVMLYVDSILYIILTLYFDKVFPSRYGQHEPFYFFLLPSYWSNLCPSKNNATKQRRLSKLQDLNINLKNYEITSTNKNNVVANNAVIIRDLKKEFTTLSLLGQNQTFKAVKGINLDIPKGQVFALLGHNGAGKTTTISMLTGLLQSTEGDAWINGMHINTQMAEIRKTIGVCPQHDVLWDRMTMTEHLKFFGRLKGIPKEYIQQCVESTIRKTHMQEKANSYPTDMSGGQKRKLSLGIALIGGSKVVFLDEPTSGMDPQSRRITWDIIEKEKENRCIVLTTHFMDEADVLGDKIAIMGNGQIRCCGSSLFLKQLYGVGYTFTVSINSNNINTGKIDEIASHVDSIILNNIPNSSKVSTAGGEITYKLPFDQSKHFSTVFQQLDNLNDINSYGISVTTLEEVFLKVGAMEEEEEEGDEENEHTTKNNSDNIKLNVPNSPKDIKDGSDDSLFNKQPTFQLKDESSFNVFVIHFFSIMYRKFYWNKRDIKAFIFQLVIPLLLSCVGLGVLTIKVAINLPKLTLNGNAILGHANLRLPVPITNFAVKGNNVTNNSFYEAFFENTNLWDGDYGFIDYSDLSANCSKYSSDSCSKYDMITFSKKLLNDFNSHSKNDIPYYGIYLPVSMQSSDEIWVGTNMSAFHSLPVGFNAVNNMFLKKYFDSTASITTSNHPLVVTETQNLVSDQFTDRYKLTKHQQLLSGISYSSYWLANYFMDLVISLPCCMLVFSCIYIFDVDAFKKAEGPFILTLILYVFSVLPFTYLLSGLFKSPDRAQTVTTTIYLFLGLILGLVSFFLDLFESTKGTNRKLKHMYRIFPPFLMSESLNNIAVKPLLFRESNYWDWKISSRDFVYMAVEGVGYMLLVLVIEYVKSFPHVLRKLGLIYNIPDKSKNNSELDIDVINEKNKINGNNLPDTVILKGLRKVYKGNGMTSDKIAVRDLYYSVKQGEVFGFLGVNGAGKTSTLAMLTGEKFPSSGEAYINGISIENQIKCRRYVGFCAREHLKFYGMVKGLKGNELERQINVLLNALSLKPFENRLAGTYSGGNKRKLSVAIAMIGNPPVIFLDEPSTGMDPVSRRHMWNFISSTMAGRCVILTTHSMEECQALCHRVGIMVKGELRCLGTPQHLKSRFGQGFQLDVKLDIHIISNDNENNQKKQLINRLNDLFSIKLLEDNINSMVFEIYTKDSNENKKSLGQMFNTLENIKNEFKIIQSYALNQTTLEQIFIKMAKDHDQAYQRDNQPVET